MNFVRRSAGPRTLGGATLVVLAALAALTLPAHRLVARWQGPPVQPLAWLAGCWELRAGARLVEEQWLAPRGGMLLGVGRTTRGDSVVEYEFMRIYTRGDTVVFAATPSGQPAAEFRGAMPSAELVTFENPAHDFPQRVQYRRVTRDSIVARVEGTQGGMVRGIDYPYRRVTCAGGTPGAP